MLILRMEPIFNREVVRRKANLGNQYHSNDMYDNNQSNITSSAIHRTFASHVSGEYG